MRCLGARILLVIKRCILMTTDPGDLVLDPTCGSGTTAYVAEQWGRRWITTDTSRVALNIAKTRLMTASFPWYTLHDEKKPVCNAKHWDVRHGFDLQEGAARHPGFAGQRRTAGRGHALRQPRSTRKAARRRPLHRRNPAKLRAAGARRGRTRPASTTSGWKLSRAAFSST
jgi:hypothetical protein